MKRAFNAVIKQDDGWWIGWVEEIPGVNSQGKTRAELLKNLRSALKEALEFNREDALAAAHAPHALRTPSSTTPLRLTSSITRPVTVAILRVRHRLIRIEIIHNPTGILQTARQSFIRQIPARHGTNRTYAAYGKIFPLCLCAFAPLPLIPPLHRHLHHVDFRRIAGAELVRGFGELHVGRGIEGHL